jgi:hypothetical protein
MRPLKPAKRGASEVLCARVLIGQVSPAKTAFARPECTTKAMGRDELACHDSAQSALQLRRTSVAGHQDC